ncbi:MAG: hypothetical protein M1815_004623, partial [Lichina confinis]
MLCAICEPITISHLSHGTYDHQPSLAALKSSAEADCSFCKLIWASLDKDTDLETMLAYCDQQVSDEQGEDVNAVDTRVRLETLNPLIPYHHMTGWQPEDIQLDTFMVYVAVGASEDVQNSFKTDITGKLRLYARLVAHYVALSYCWGAPQTVVTTEQTLEDYTVDIDVSTLSRSLRDAIRITQALGLRYIWIDALCIIQEQPHLSDFKAEALKIGQYYRNAYLTLIAGNAADSRDGFLNDRPPAAAEACSLDYFFWDITRSIWTHKVGSLYACLPSSVDIGPTEERAWTYQEAVLSNRKLTYGREQIWFECQAMMAYEDGSSEKVVAGQSSARTGTVLPSLRMAAEDPDLTRRKREMYRLWYRNLVPYTTRTTTKPDDKFAAVAGIADLVQKTVLSRYLFGLWEDDMVRGLLWRSCMYHAQGPHRVPLKPRRGSPLPSWSWASVEGPISVTFGETTDCRFSNAENRRAKILGMDNATGSLDPIYSETLTRSSFELKFEGILKHVHATNPDEFFDRAGERWLTYQKAQLRPQVTALVPETALHFNRGKDRDNDPSPDERDRVIGLGYFDLVDDAHSQTELWCVQLISQEGLLLKHCGDGAYRRL